MFADGIGPQITQITQIKNSMRTCEQQRGSAGERYLLLVNRYSEWMTGRAEVKKIRW